MRLVLTLALVTGLAAICQGQIRAAAAGLPQPAQGAMKTKCAAAASPGAASGSAAAPSTNPACGDRLDWRLSQHGPGFWTADPAASAPGDAAGGPSPSVLRATPAQASANAPPGCMNYQVMVVIGGEPREATIAACPQPDGNWQVTQYTPGLPAQSFTVPAPTTPGPSPTTAGPSSEEEFGAWGPAPAWDWAAAPWFFGFAPAVVVVGPRFHHFHHFDHEFGHGFAHGFAHRFGFAHGFTVRHGFAAGRGFAPGHRFAFPRGFGFGHGVAVAHGFAVGHGPAVTRGFVGGRSFTAGAMHGFAGGAGFAGRGR